ncbi:MAG: glucose-1-phosphate adenylyltransferase [Candidatus Hydrogenedentes bacterium]|nr:glucose-1-phosphate adenylyltransferase [Candidatus Hydrogenedentota bacterium]HOJ68164.1 glucose-1-phosphate adenylyltransferase [Candidatus Hydrogenedentota bacterium]
MYRVLSILLAGGAGERLYPLTKNRAKPAVPFGGIYRIVDFTLSNCLNSGCRRILVLTQYKSNSLNRHINRAWVPVMHPELGEFIEVIPPQMRVNSNWYLGTADAIYQNLYSIDQASPREVLILSGDHIYKMNYQKMVQQHREAEAELTIAAIDVPSAEATRFGVFEVDGEGRVLGFEEKPKQPKEIPGRPGHSLASMGIYVFNAETLRKMVSEDAENSKSSHDFGKDIIPRMVREQRRVFAYKFEDENKKEAKYWRDVGTLDSYWEANMDLVAVDPQFNLYDQEWPLRTYVPMLPPAKFVFAEIGNRYGAALDSIVSPGCIISGGVVDRSVLSPAVRVNSYARVEESILLDGVNIGRHCRIRRAIIEKNVSVPEGTVLGYNLEEDSRRFRVTDMGVVVVESTDRFREA